MSSRVWVPLAAAAVAAGCVAVVSCSSSDRPGTPNSDDTSVQEDALADVVFVDTRPPDTTPKDASPDGGDGADDADARGDGGTLCPSLYPDVAPTPVGYAHGTSQADLLAALTWDERTMAWTTSESGTIVVHYADRAGRDDAFTGERVLPSSLGPFADDKVALGADGLTMVFMSADHQVAKRITRTARDVAFDPASATSAPFAHITGSKDGLPTPQIADLVVSKDGKWLFYTDLLRTSGASMMLSLALPDGTWDLPNPVETPHLRIEDGFRRRPTGLSSDTLTLFFYDEGSESSWFAMRKPGSAVFDTFNGVTPRGRRAMPSDACDRVYLSVTTLLDPDAGVPDADDADAPATVTRIMHTP